MTTTTTITKSTEAPAALSPEFAQTFIGHVVAVVVGVIALIHPGFREPGVVQAAVPGVAVAASALLASVYARSGHQLRADLAKAAAAAGAVASALPTPSVTAITPEQQAVVEAATGAASAVAH